DELAAVGRGVAGLRAQRAETIHLTIRFLGGVEDPEPVAAAAAAVASRHAPFDVSLKGAHAFPDARRPRVVWVGLGAGEEAARALAADVEAAVTALGFPPEERPWSAHITLGRFRDRPPKPPHLDPTKEFGRARADRLVFFRSVLTPEGALHEAFRELSLGGGT
ncbi:MAG: RNA 2',3'-cyclic phosphodiesterase, partial [Candidatus Rokubacteria bacterium]|nr:RNA 2',3'-cyclic phosphodiesterase [Candidatus Rokubacteria bacterium]